MAASVSAGAFLFIEIDLAIGFLRVEVRKLIFFSLFLLLLSLNLGASYLQNLKVAHDATVPRMLLPHIYYFIWWSKPLKSSRSEFNDRLSSTFIWCARFMTVFAVDWNAISHFLFCDPFATTQNFNSFSGLFLFVNQLNTNERTKHTRTPINCSNHHVFHPVISSAIAMIVHQFYGYLKIDNLIIQR